MELSSGGRRSLGIPDPWSWWGKIDEGEATQATTAAGRAQCWPDRRAHPDPMATERDGGAGASTTKARTKGWFVAGRERGGREVAVVTREVRRQEEMGLGWGTR